MQLNLIFGTPQVCCLRLLGCLSSSKDCVSALWKGPVLEALVTLPGRDGSLHPDLGLILLTMYKVVSKFNPSDRPHVVHEAIRVQLFEYLLSLLENERALAHVKRPNTARVAALSTLWVLTNDRMYGQQASTYIKKLNKKTWDRKFKLEASKNRDMTRVIYNEPDSYFSGAAANCDAVLKQMERSLLQRSSRTSARSPTPN